MLSRTSDSRRETAEAWTDEAACVRPALFILRSASRRLPSNAFAFDFPSAATYLRTPDPGQDEVELHRFDALVGAKRKNAKLSLVQVSKCLLGGLAENSSLDLFNNR
jgi:hypothetical protein